MADSEKGDRLENGTIFKSRYEITGFLGEGGFATVYRAKDVEIGREVAIKILHVFATVVDPTTHLSIVERFRQEARTAASISHPGVVTIFDVGMTDDNHPYIIMDSLNGHDLEHELENNGPMELKRALPLFCRVLEALSEAHRAGIVHKDLKPSNLFLTDPGTPRENISILDFGIARVTEDVDARLTSAGQILGTPRYMAPEYIDSQTVSPSTDVYQMGLILIEMLKGVPVVGQETLISCIMVHAQGVDIPDDLARTPLGPLLAKALEKDPALRYQDCDTFLRDLFKTDFSSMGMTNAAVLMQTRTTTGWMPAVSANDVPARPTKDAAPVEKTADKAPRPIEADPAPKSKGGALKVVGGLGALAFVVVLAAVGLHFAGVFKVPGLPSAVSEAGSDKPAPVAESEFIKTGDDQMKKGNWKEAIKSFKAAIDESPDNKEAKARKKSAEKEKKLQKHFDAGHKALKKDDIKASRSKFEKIPDSSFYFARIASVKEDAIAGKIAIAEKALKKDDFGKAQAAIDIAGQIDPKNKALRKLLKKLPSGGPMVKIAGGALARGTSKEVVPAAIKLCKKTKAKGEGCSAKTFSAEQPESIIGMRAFLIDRFEVTNAAYSACVKAKKCSKARYSSTCGNEDKSIRDGKSPVVCVTWTDASAFCKWADKRLPSEAEWSTSARGTLKKGAQTAIYPWGTEFKSVWTNWGDAGKEDTYKWAAPAGALKRDVSRDKVRDLAGNVAEWTSDWFDPKFYKEKATTSPTNKKASKTRSVRGASWASGGHTTRISWRQGLEPDKFNSFTGFRCAADAKK